MIIEDSIKHDMKIYVPNNDMRHLLTEKMYNIMDCMEYKPEKHSRSYIYNHYFVTPDDITTGIYRSQHISKILVDNSCTPKDINILINCTYFIIENGFVYIPYGI